MVRQLSENPTFREFYSLPGTRLERIEAGDGLVEANRALGFLERLYPESIGEACFIDRGGAENARVVRGEIAPPDDLSQNEDEAPFFTPTFALDFGQVYQTEPYVSPDTDEWVVANSTLVPFADGVRRALVHFEVTIESFRRVASSDSHIRIVDDAGFVVVDSRRAQEVGAPLGWSDQEQFAGLAEALLPTVGPDETVLSRIGDDVVAVRALATGGVTPNRWYLVSSAPVRTGLIVGLTGSTLLMFVGGMLILALALASMFLAERRLRDQATTDSLTGLPNRTLFADRVGQALRLARRQGNQAAVLLLDIDRFKEVNDTLGHHRGDLLLVELAARMREAVREADMVARLGGDEFAVFLPETGGVNGAVEAAQRLKEALGVETAVDGIPFHVEASVGVALYPDHGQSVQELLQRADVAMYRAKRAGTDYAVYSTAEDPNSSERLALIAELRTGIERDELVVHYQPKYDLRSMEVVGAEALVRWDHPTRGLMPPDQFVPLAEVSGQLRGLTNVVMLTAFRQLARWNEDGHDLNIAVNISPRSLADPTFIVDLENALELSGVRSDRVILEVTEDSLIDEADTTQMVLSYLQRQGFTISVDDFGTGYSSLSYLRDLPVDEVKIDRSFILNMADTPADLAIVTSTISLASTLGYRVVAEGIETQEVLERLVDLGCDAGQGFLLSRPQAPEYVVLGADVPSPS